MIRHMESKRKSRKPTRSVALQRRNLRSNKDALAADYGAGDLLKTVGLSQAQLKSWLRDGVLVPTGEANGLRVFDLKEMVLAEVARRIAPPGASFPVQRIMLQVRAYWEAKHWTVTRVLAGEPPAELKIDLAGEVVSGSKIVRHPDLKPVGEPEGEPVSLTLKINLTDIAAMVVAKLINPALAAAEDDGARAKSA